MNLREQIEEYVQGQPMRPQVLGLRDASLWGARLALEAEKARVPDVIVTRFPTMDGKGKPRNPTEVRVAERVVADIDALLKELDES